VSADAGGPGVGDLVRVDALRELLRTGTGAGVRVGIIDTGVDSAHDDLQGRLKASYDVVVEGGGVQVVARERGVDAVGHGTACAGIIHRLAPDAALYDVRALGSGPTNTGAKLVHGLKFAIEQGWDVINLSLGTNAERLRDPLSKLADLAYYKGVLLIAAKDNHAERAYPAALSSLVAVDMDHFEDPTTFRYHADRITEVEAEGVYVEAPSPGNQRGVFTGTSFACPHVTGLTVRLRQHVPDLTPFQLKTFLHALRENADPGA